MTLSLELLAMIKDVPASDEEIEQWVKPFASHTSAYIVRLIARIVEERKVGERADALEDSLSREVDDYRAGLARCKEALEWYANPEIYKPHPHGLAFDNRDLSYTARAALSALEGEE